MVKHLNKQKNSLFPFTKYIMNHSNGQKEGLWELSLCLCCAETQNTL